MSIYLIWFLIGMAFFIFELLSPAFILFFFGLGAWVTALATAAFSDITFNQQIILFSTSSIALLLLLRNYVKTIFFGKQNDADNQYFNEGSSIDKSAVITQTITPGSFGKIKFKGTFYRAKCKDNELEIKVGENVNVINQGDEQGSFYFVEKK